jgi:adenylate cyclase
MAFEIERKFLVRGEGWRELIGRTVRMRQAYLAAEGRASVRVRIKDDRDAAVTFESRTAERRRLELEYAVPVLEAEALIALRRGAIIEKHRHLISHAGETWEVDVFEVENAGLIIAEIELREEDQQIDLPSWVGPEVTGQASYYNSALAMHPFGSWSREKKRTLGL